ncbi:hypothetical protein VNO78_22550 [Psophocarpus tetragonolobus]|uniref:Transmembrane protein n=1 Tax=Psophocarpus tetragonolobus TaxID=3891 RepID=A0AAN9S223_PSOTE
MPSKKTSSMPSNPNSRSSEISDPMRRSFTGNPFIKPSIVPNHGAKTPVNSPSDFSRRGSIGVRESGGGSLRDSLDDKENGKDHTLKPAKVRSPAVSSKGSKNFMSPTISASFKINESPRKKILVERNEPVLSPLDSKTHVRKVTFAEPLEQKRTDEMIPNFEDGPRSSLTSEDLGSEIHHMNVPLISKNDTALSFESVNVNAPLVLENDIHTESSFETEPDCVNLDPTFKLSPTATPPVSLKATVVAPLDADPLLPPYDPTTNYLSPRPQFLHYKPKPRMELCRERELEDSFISESFSDTEGAEDAQSLGSQKESEDVSSDETPPHMETLIPVETAEAKQVPRARFTVRAKAIALILLLGIAFVSISVTDSPVIDQTVFEKFYKVYETSEISEFARANFELFTRFAKINFDEMARNLQILFTKLLSSISEFISDVKGASSLAKFPYYNLTIHHDYSVVNQYPTFGRGENEISKTHAPVWDYEGSDATSDIESDATSDIESDADVEEDISMEHYEVYEHQVQEDIATTSGVENVLVAPESEEVLNMIESEQLREAEYLEANLAQEVEANLNVENQPSLNSEVAEISIEAYGADAKQAQENNAKFDANERNDVSLDSDVAAVNDEVAEEKLVSIDAAIKGNEEQWKAIGIPVDVMLYLVLGVGTVLIAGTALNRSRRVKSKSQSSMEIHQNSVPSPEKSSGAIEMGGVEDSSCPSEASSFQQSEKVVKEVDRAGPEKKRKNNNRRESWASSSSDYSMGSPSYGSLTVYEKIPTKQGHGEEEIITPVRRSSRIRNQATSPS